MFLVEILKVFKDCSFNVVVSCFLNKTSIFSLIMTYNMRLYVNL